jgi:sugar phosphate isomerase/epimerase
MDCGIKCEPKRLAAEDWRAAYGDLPKLARQARAHGAAFIELKWEEDTPAPLMLEFARQAADAGLWVSVHPYLWQLGPEAFTEATHAAGLRQTLDLAAEISQITGHDVPLIFHAGHVHMEPHQAPYADALRRARDFFAWAVRETQRRPRVRVMSETQLPVRPPEPRRARLADTWAECMRSVEDVPLGICWDFGHTFLGSRYGKHAAFPPPEFLRKVGHVHAHDVIQGAGAALEDHQPLGSGLAPWRENLRRLAAVGYSGGILLETDIASLGGYVGLAAMLDFATREIGAAFDGI